MSYTLGTASKATGKSKATILRAIRNGKLSAEKDANGVWRIEPSELHRVYPETPIETVSESKDDALVNPETPIETVSESKDDALVNPETPIETVSESKDDALVNPETPIETVSESKDDALVNPSKHLEAPLLEERLASAQKEITHLKAQVENLKGQRERLRLDMEAWRSAATQKRLTWRGLFGGSRSE